MNFKKKVNGSWHDIPHYVHNTSTDTITTLPADIYPNAATATVGLKGNISQTGTPTPDNPIQPSECGERTGNLFDDHNIIPIPGLGDKYGVVLPPGTYSIYNGTDNRVYDGSQNFRNRHLACEAHSTATVTIATNPGTTCGFLMNLNAASQGGVTIVSGSTAPSSYIPYGYKIPISSASTTTPVYLGEVETTRKIGKHECTGEEDWRFYSETSSTYGAWQFYIDGVINGMTKTSAYSNVAGYGVTSETRARHQYGVYLVTNGTGIAFQMAGAKDTFTNVTAWKNYLAAQYAAGTPVTVWYVLAEPETGIVNEPLMRIGNYADEVANISIPVTAGGDTLSVDTTLQPSEVTVNYKGWHPAIVHERANGAWT